MSQASNVFDVVVGGGGPAGIGAAVAAARTGKRAALIERYPVLGGMGTAALVNNFCPAHWDGERFIIGGVFGELRHRLIERKAIYSLKPLPTTNPILEPYNPDVFAEEVATLCHAAGVTLRVNTKITAVEFVNEQRASVRLEDGQHLTTTTVVDATGDALIAHHAGVPSTFGNPDTHAVMPLTFCYMIGPIDLAAARAGLPEAVRYDEVTGETFFYFSGWHPVVDQWVKEARQKGELSIPRDHISAIVSVPGQPNYATVNFGRVTIADPTDPAQLLSAEAEGRRQVEEGIRFFRKYIPGLQHVELVQLARQIGVRETRQITGLYTLTAEDVLSCRQFEDCIAQCCYPIDIHEPGKDTTLMKHLPHGAHYDIPWRCLVPRSGPDNLIVAGRSISATPEAMSSFRVSPAVLAIGEAAGVTAARAVECCCAIRNVNPADVQQRLLETGAILA
ncbi:MAG: FAD-dependent oxidoreductase [Chloroflexi bacterium]|nr:FAD-dependent oxidoreductase [Chloroflexota bacterium]